MNLDAIETELEKKYYSASASYDEDDKSLTINLRTKMRASMTAFQSVSRPIGHLYKGIKVISTSKGRVKIGTECDQYLVKYSGSVSDESKKVNPSTVFDPHVNPGEIAKKAIKAGQIADGEVSEINVRHVAY